MLIFQYYETLPPAVAPKMRAVTEYFLVPH